MSVLKERLQADMKAAMKAGEKDRLGVIRLIMAGIKQREVDERIQLDDVQVLSVLDKMVKQRRESIAQFQAAGRDDLVAAEQAELGIIQDYLPQPLSEEEVESLIRAAVAELDASRIADMGRVMAVLKPKMQGRADLAMVSSRVKSLLSG
ncbi:GatB/Yqey domain-containing protein [Methylocaldum marinum]|uniref:GatB/Yqey domain-containing protein n=1 Tax=Methylocaldum marinum TaxID=1432792 RepID=A0A250KYD7_9GAMM|nr:GatB/YqeY domain-containing protein [Methylocaldum marinum]BBA36627.1 GatB/Yqey domain-containing protein [Methylocaldum marinum]